MRFQVELNRTADAWELIVVRLSDGMPICRGLFRSRDAAQAALDLLWM